MIKNFIAILSLLIFLPFSSATAQNKQPISTSLAECSVIFMAVSQSNYSGRQSAERIEAMRLGSRAFQDAAYLFAKKEGHDKPKAHINTQLPDLMAKWQPKIGSMLAMKEMFDWVGYCGSLGKKIGILPLKK